MELSVLQKYLLVANALSFGLAWLSMGRRKRKGGIIGPVLNGIVLLGGSLGALLGFACFGRKVTKQNGGWIVYASCMLVLQSVACLAAIAIGKGRIRWGGAEAAASGAMDFARNHPWLWIYLLAINLVTALAFALDKGKAVRGRWRIKESTLLLLSFLGGSLGGLAAMRLCHHKTKAAQFSFGVPMMLFTQLIALAFWVALSW